MITALYQKRGDFFRLQTAAIDNFTAAIDNFGQSTGFAGNFFKFSISIFYKAEARFAGYITRDDCSAPVRGADPRRQERAHAQRLHLKFGRQRSSDPMTAPLRIEIPALQSVTETVTVDYKRWSVRHLPRLLVLAAALLCLLPRKLCLEQRPNRPDQGGSRSAHLLSLKDGGVPFL